MSDDSRLSTPTSGEKPAGTSESPLSLQRLRDAFAAMLKPASPAPAAQAAAKTAASSELRTTTSDRPIADPCEICPRSVVEAILFVGRPDDGTISAKELAASMRGVSPSEVASVIDELNDAYTKDGAPYEVVGSPQGYRLNLRDEYSRVRDKFYGRVREAKLSQAALEVLACVAYNQPATVEKINELRGRPCGGVLSTLVRRQLVRQERSGARGDPTRYSTTDRFLRLFGLESLAALPRSEELEKA